MVSLSQVWNDKKGVERAGRVLWEVEYDNGSKSDPLNMAMIEFSGPLKARKRKASAEAKDQKDQEDQKKADAASTDATNTQPAAKVSRREKKLQTMTKKAATTTKNATNTAPTKENDKESDDNDDGKLSGDDSDDENSSDGSSSDGDEDGSDESDDSLDNDPNILVGIDPKDIIGGTVDFVLLQRRLCLGAEIHCL